MTVELHVPQPAPLDVASSLALFRRSGDDLIDRWDGQTLIRAVPIAPDTWIPFVARAGVVREAPHFSVLVESTSHVEPVRRVVADTFMPAPAYFARLLQEDQVIARLDGLFPGIRQIRQLDVFTAFGASAPNRSTCAGQ